MSDLQYRYDLVEEPSEDVTCPLCLDVTLDPLESGCCGKHFCRECTEKLGKSSDCPSCKEEDVNFFAAKYFQREILNRLKVYCDKKSDGCEWSGQLSDSELHKRTCPSVMVDCEKCGEKFKRGEAEAHKTTVCPKRPYECRNCDLEAPYDEIKENHEPNCEGLCPNHCDAQPMARKDVDNHLKNECLLQVIECTFSIAGCSERLLRKDMPKHLADNGPHHAAMASLETLRSLKLETKEKDDRLKQMASMEKRIVELEAKVQESQDIDRYIRGEAPYTIIGPPTVMPRVLAVISGAEKWNWPFTTHLNGYQMCFYVRTERSNLSVTCENMIGAHDSNLKWPVDIHIVIRLLNQLQNANHVEFHVCMENVRQIETDMWDQTVNAKTAAAEQCLTFAKLEYDESCDTQYLKGDTLKFQIEILKLDVVQP